MGKDYHYPTNDEKEVMFCCSLREPNRCMELFDRNDKQYLSIVNNLIEDDCLDNIVFSSAEDGKKKYIVEFTYHPKFKVYIAKKYVLRTFDRVVWTPKGEVDADMFGCDEFSDEDVRSFASRETVYPRAKPRTPKVFRSKYPFIWMIRGLLALEDVSFNILEKEMFVVDIDKDKDEPADTINSDILLRELKDIKDYRIEMSSEDSIPFKDEKIVLSIEKINMQRLMEKYYGDEIEKMREVVMKASAYFNM